jgi:hypothetical protein
MGRERMVARQMERNPRRLRSGFGFGRYDCFVGSLGEGLFDGAPSAYAQGYGVIGGATGRRPWSPLIRPPFPMALAPPLSRRAWRI